MVDIKIPFRIDNEEVIMHYYSGQRKIYDEGIVDIMPYYKISIVLTDGLEARLVSGESWMLEAGNVSVFSPYEAHFGRFLRSGHFEYVEFLVHEKVFKTENDLKNLLLFIKENNELHYYLKKEEQRQIIEIMNKAVEKCLLDELVKDLKISACFIDFIDYLQNIPQNRLTRQSLRIVPPKIRQTMEYIAKNYVYIKNVKDITTFSECSSEYITRAFKKHLGITPYEYLINMKLHSAESILRAGGSVTEACYDSGFTDYSHFIQVFKKYYGITPNRFKKR